MNKFKKIVAVEPVNLTKNVREKLDKYGEEIIFYPDLPKDNQEIIQRIGDADAVLVSYVTKIEREVLEAVPNVKYIGMCCSLYSEESANVDIAYARKKGIVVTGVRDYGDKGVVEYVIYQLVRILHGYDFPMWREKSLELTGMNIGMVGIGASGGIIADALHFLGADISYYARSVKEEREAKGMHYKELTKLLNDSEVIITCLNKNIILLNEKEFEALGNGKIMINTSIGPAADADALKKWLAHPENIFCCDTKGALGESAEELLSYDNVICMNASSGMTAQAYELLGEKALKNMEDFLS
ncbi:MAG: dihydrofolate reductase [Lachnospiraceae bacterium]|nr:dihydrofolate reductase [Lachnospiraceae bacterium]